MYTTTIVLSGQEYTITAYISPNGNRNYRVINFTASHNSVSFTVSQSFNVRDINTQENIWQEFRGTVIASYSEFLKAQAYLTNRGFVPVVAGP